MKPKRQPITECKQHFTDAEKLPYVAWHEKAAKANAAGEKQTQCMTCYRWFFTWERHDLGV